MSILNPLNRSFGLDISDRSFKAVQISKGRGERPYRLEAWGSVEVPEGVLERGEIVDPERAAEMLKKLLSRTKGRLRGRSAVVCLPESRSFVKMLETEATDRDGIQKAVVQELEQNIPLPIEEIYYDWHPIDGYSQAAEPAKGKDRARANGQTEAGNENPEPAKTGERRVMMAAAPRKLVDAYTQMVEMAGLAPIAFEIEAVAIARAMIAEGERMDEPIGLLDIGATRSSLIVCDEGAMQMSISVPLSGMEITQAISERLSIGLADAEKVKIECGLDARRCEDRMWSILLPLIDDMSAKIRNSLRFYRIGFPSGKKIEHLALCGGGALFRDIDTVLSRKLTIKVRRGDPLANVGRMPKGFTAEMSMGYATAIGLAIRAAEEGRRFRQADIS